MPSINIQQPSYQPNNNNDKLYQLLYNFIDDRNKAPILVPQPTSTPSSAALLPTTPVTSTPSSAALLPTTSPETAPSSSSLLLTTSSEKRQQLKRKIQL